MKNISFKKKLIASTIGTYAMVGLSGMAMAQDNQLVAEEVIVTGIRGSLMRSMDIKRDAQGIVDAISAEDMGKFPDTNLAESLQRITGVSIDRRDGEGSKITVRGLGPDFNLVLLNGRQMPGASLEATAASGSRSFDFANIAAEGVKRVEVYKTQRADVAPGGMGATIQIITPRPLEDEPTISLGAKAVFDQSNSGDVTPEISGIFSQQYMDGKLGVALVGSYQERDYSTAAAQVGTGWRSFPGTITMDWGTPGAAEWGGISPANSMNFPEAEDVYSSPQQVGYVFSDVSRTRLNGQATIQFMPTDDVTLTLDYITAQNELDATTTDVGGWFNFGGQSTIFTNYDSPAVQTPVLYSEDMTNGDLPFGVGETAVKYDNQSVGFNVEWQATERLNLALDMHSSSAEAAPNNEFGNSAGIAVSAFVRDRTTADFRGDMPVLYVDVAAGDGSTNLLVSDLLVSGSFFRWSEMKHEIDQVQFDGDFELSDEWNLGFGLARTEGEVNSAFSNVQRDSWGGLGSAGDLPAEFFTRADILGEFDADIPQITAEQAAHLGMATVTPLNERLVGDFQQIRDFAAANYRDGIGMANCEDGSTWYCAAPPTTFTTINEDSNSAYVTVNYESELAGMPVTANLGLRYEETEVESPTSQALIYGAAEWVSGNEITIPATVGESVTTTQSGDYSYVLPALDLSIEPMDDVVVRASYSESIARPNWLDLGGERVAQLARFRAGGNASRGDASLKPYESDNIDLSVEWYYDDASYASVGYFRKEVANFISTNSETEAGVADTVDPTFGPRAQAAIDAGVNPTDSNAIRQYILDNFPDAETAYQNEYDQIIIVGIDDPTDPLADPVMNFLVTTPFNSDKTVTVDGFEVALQHNFWDTGFGVVANYTYVDSDSEFDDMLLNEPQFAITGVSDTANLVGFYDKNGLQVRLAYNWRDDFLASTASGTGANPIYVEAYGQIDLNVSYELTDSLNVFVEGINIGEESGRNYGRSTDQVLGYYQGYARYNVGARYVF